MLVVVVTTAVRVSSLARWIFSSNLSSVLTFSIMARQMEAVGRAPSIKVLAEHGHHLRVLVLRVIGCTPLPRDIEVDRLPCKIDEKIW